LHTQSTESRASKPRSPRNGRSALDLYLDRAGRYQRLSAEEERAALCDIVAHRIARWRALLSCPSMTRAVLTYLVQEDLDDRPQDTIDHVLELIAVLERRPNVVNADALSRATSLLAEALAAIDHGVGDHVAELLERFAAGDDHPFEVPASLLCSEVLNSYLRRVRSAQRKYLRLRNRFLCRNLRLVVKIATRYGNNRMSLADRVQEGNFGLLKAVERFDPARGTRFSTYAGWWIRHHITRALVNRGREIRIPAHLHRVFMKARAVEPDLRSRLGRDPTMEELAEAVGIDRDKVADAREAMELRAIGLETPTSDDDSRSVADTLEAPVYLDVGAELDAVRNIELATDAIASLEPMARDIVQRRFGLDGCEPWTLRRLGERYDLSRERIRQLQNKALRHIRDMIDPTTAPSVAA
jgi:RNA polymerase primary sigma factor